MVLGTWSLESWASMCNQLESTVTIYSLQSRSTCALSRLPGCGVDLPTLSRESFQHPDGGRPVSARCSLGAPSPTRSALTTLVFRVRMSAFCVHQQALPAYTLTRVNGSVNIYGTCLMQSAFRISSTSDQRFLHKKPFIWREGPGWGVGNAGSREGASWPAV